mmetsp:Transcript_28845/g.46636  ORF Transcript_28845/g.46636 Transcript_28845/m.46636 type:complete len:86 (+) Transcript_28845:371-628(+)
MLCLPQAFSSRDGSRTNCSVCAQKVVRALRAERNTKLVPSGFWMNVNSKKFQQLGDGTGGRFNVSTCQQVPLWYVRKVPYNLAAL